MLNKFLFSGAIAHSVLKSENYWHVTSSRREKCTSSQVHFISKGTSSHKSFHPICYFILYVTSSHRSFHPIRHFKLWLIVYESFNPTSDFIPVNISRLILFFHFIPPTTFTPPVYFSLRDEVSWNVVPGNQLKIYIRSDPSPTLYGCHQDTSSPTSVTNIDLIIVEICKGRLNSEKFFMPDL